MFPNTFLKTGYSGKFLEPLGIFSMFWKDSRLSENFYVNSRIFFWSTLGGIANCRPESFSASMSAIWKVFGFSVSGICLPTHGLDILSPYFILFCVFYVTNAFLKTIKANIFSVSGLQPRGTVKKQKTIFLCSISR